METDHWFFNTDSKNDTFTDVWSWNVRNAVSFQKNLNLFLREKLLYGCFTCEGGRFLSLREDIFGKSYNLKRKKKLYQKSRDFPEKGIVVFKIAKYFLYR